MLSDKERIEALKLESRQQELEIDKKNELLAQYESIESVADKKIKAINTIHSEKVRCLMNSITLLKKENLTLKKSNKEHKRSELIEDLNKQIGDQDTIIEVLRRLVNNDETSDKEIVKALTKGPPRLRVESREELKIEIKKLKNQVLLVKNGSKKNVDENTPPNNGVNQNIPVTQNTKDLMNESVVSDKTDFNENFFYQLNTLKAQNEDLQLSLKAQEVIQSKLEQELEERIKEITNLELTKTDFQVLSKKYETLQAEFEKEKETKNSKFMMSYDKEIRLQELEIMHKTNQTKLSQVEANITLEIENFKAIISDLSQKNEEITAENEQLLTKYNDLIKKNSELSQNNKKITEKNTLLLKEKDDQKKKFEKNIEDQQTLYSRILEEKIKLESDLSDSIKNVTDLTNGLFQKSEEIKLLEKQIANLLSQIRTNEEHFKRTLNEKLALEKITNATKPKNEDENAENIVLRKKIKELTVQQIELEEAIEAMDLEIRLRNRKEGANSIKTKLLERKNNKINGLAKYISELETENDKLRVLYDKMDSNISLSVKESDKNNVYFGIDSNISISSKEISSKISTPKPDQSFIETNSDLSIENENLRAKLKGDQSKVINLKLLANKLGKETPQPKKKDPVIIEKDNQIKVMAEKISELNLSKSDLDSKISRVSLKNLSLIDSNISQIVDSNISISNFNKEEDLEYTDSNISLLNENMKF